MNTDDRNHIIGLPPIKPIKNAAKHKDMFGNPLPKKKKQTEGQLQTQVCNYIRMQYPSAIFSSDLASGMKLQIFVAARHKALRSDRAFPDLLILENKRDKDSNLLFAALAIELKSESPFLKDGVTLKKQMVKVKKHGIVIEEYDHLREQAEMLERLRVRGWMACFSAGFQQTKEIIDNYLK